MSDQLEPPYSVAGRIRRCRAMTMIEETPATSDEGLRLQAGFVRISSEPIRSYVITLVEALGEAPRSSAALS